MVSSARFSFQVQFYLLDIHRTRGREWAGPVYGEGKGVGAAFQVGVVQLRDHFIAFDVIEQNEAQFDLGARLHGLPDGQGERGRRAVVPQDDWQRCMVVRRVVAFVVRVTTPAPVDGIVARLARMVSRLRIVVRISGS